MAGFQWFAPGAVTPKAETPEPPPQPPNSGFQWFAPAPASPDTSENELRGSVLSRPLSETFLGGTATSAYESAVKRLLPDSMQKERGSSWMGRFTTEIAKGGPEILDFIQSPLGAALTAAHLFPATLPFAAIVDVGLGGIGIMQSIPEIKKALSDGTPESWAGAIKGMAFSLGMVKGGSKTLLARTMKFRAEPLEQREALRSDIQTTPPSINALMTVAEKYKKVPASEIASWAKKPLSEVEDARRKSEVKYKTLREKTLKRAREEKRTLTSPEKQMLRSASEPMRFLKSMGDVLQPAKTKALEEARAVRDPTRSQKFSERVYANAWLREPAKIINIPKPRMMQVSADVVFDGAAFLAKRSVDINRMLYDWQKVVPVEDRDVRKMGYVIQGSATAEEVGLSPQARSMLPIIREWTKAQDELLYGTYGQDLPLQESDTYLTQAWKMQNADQATRTRARRTLMNDPFLKKKTIDNYKFGIEELHLEPRYNDIFDLLRLRADFASKAIANRRMAGWFRDLGAIITEAEHAKLRPAMKLTKTGEQGQTPTGVPYGSETNRAFADWQPATEAVALYRAAYTDKPMEPGMKLAPVYVHPDFYDAVNAWFGKGFDNPVFNTSEVVRALGKKTALTFSMFHHWALSEQAQAIYATRKNPITTLSKTFFFNPEFYRGVKSGIWEAVHRDGGAPPAMRIDEKIVGDAVEHGLNLKSEETEHFLYSKIQDMAMSHNLIQKAIGVTGKPVTAVLKGWDRALWDYYHQGMMLDCYEMLKSQELAKLGPDASPAKIKETKRAIAEHINNAFGSVNFTKMLLSPKIRQSLNWMFLAPAWTFSNIRVLTSGYETEAGVRLTNRYVAGAAASWFLTTQAMNMALSGWYNRDDKGKPQPRLTYDNPGLPFTVAGQPVTGLNENSFNIYAGKNTDGSDRYILFGKGFREPFRWATDPMQMFWGKLSLPVRGALVQATGHTAGTGFEEIDSRASTSEQLQQRASALTESVGLPFVARDIVKGTAHTLFPRAVSAPQSASQFMSLPTSKGASFMRAEKAYRDALDDGDGDRARDVRAVAAANNINWRQIVQTYKSDESKRRKRAAQ